MRKRGGSRKKTYGTHPLVAENQLAEFNSRCEAVWKDLGISPEENEDLHFLGTRVLDPCEGSSKTHYYSRLRKFIKFLLKNKFYDDSLIFFHPRTPKDTIAVEDKPVQRFLLALYTKKGEEVPDPRTVNSDKEEPLLFPNGNPVLGIGDWNDPDNCNSFRAALDHMHTNRCTWKNTPYEEQCPQCLEQYDRLEAEGKLSIPGCRNHPIRRIKRIGNVAKSTLVGDTILFIHRFVSWTTGGSNVLMPCEVRDIRDHCITQRGDKVSLMVYNVMLTGIYQFMRSFEVLQLESENFDHKAFSMQSNFVPNGLYMDWETKQYNTKENRPLSVKGGTRRRHSYLFLNNDYEDIDPVRNLLAWLNLIGWKGGFLFPSEEELNNPPSNGIYQTHMSDDSLRDKLDVMYRDVLNRTDRLGTHTFRKTGYLFSRLGGGDWHGIMQAANHKTYEIADRYDKGLACLGNLIRLNGDLRNMVGVWHSPRAIPSENFRRVCAPGAQFQKPLHELAEGFMRHVIGIHPDDPRSQDIRHISRQLQLWRFTPKPEIALDGILHNISGPMVAGIRTSVGQITSKAEGVGVQKGRKLEADRQSYIKQVAICNAKKEFEASYRANPSGVDFQMVFNIIEKQIFGSCGKPLDQDCRRPPSSSINPDILPVMAGNATATTQTQEVPNPAAAEMQEATNQLEPPENDDTIAGVSRSQSPLIMEERLDKKGWQQFCKNGSLGDRADFLMKYVDVVANKYRKSDANLLSKVKPWAKCFRDCCQKDMHCFLTLHFDGQPEKFTGSFATLYGSNKLKNCLHCTVEKNYDGSKKRKSKQANSHPPPKRNRAGTTPPSQSRQSSTINTQPPPTINLPFTQTNISHVGQRAALHMSSSERDAFLKARLTSDHRGSAPSNQRSESEDLQRVLNSHNASVNRLPFSPSGLR